MFENIHFDLIIESPRKLELIDQRRWCEKLDIFTLSDIFWPWLDLENLFLIIIKIKSNGSQ